ncbi:MAG: helix-hairpin-helix domain-containing protein [Bacillota bacterium]|nr:helix-hairpin-helix domain-containing protein [Bacillota bacterium]
MPRTVRGPAAGVALLLLLAAAGLWWVRAGSPAQGAGRGAAGLEWRDGSAGQDGSGHPGSGRPPSSSPGEVQTPEGGPGDAGGSSGGSRGALLWVHVAGAVRRPGLYPLHEGARLGEALEAAGGPTDQAAADLLNLAAPLADGVRVTVPTRQEAARFPGWPVLSSDPGAGVAAAPPGAAAPGGWPATGEGGAASAGPAGGTQAGGRLDLNRATAEELDRLPGIGPARAQAIVALREARGGFRSVDELLEVRGIGPALLEELRSRVRVGPP